MGCGIATAAPVFQPVGRNAEGARLGLVARGVVVSRRG